MAYNANASQLQTALLNIFGGSAGSPNVAVTGTAGNLTLTFQNALAAVRVGGAFTVDATALTGTGSSANVTNVTRGSAGAGQLDVYAAANTDGTQVPTAVLRRDFASDPTGGCADKWRGRPAGAGAGVAARRLPRRRPGRVRFHVRVERLGQVRRRQRHQRRRGDGPRVNSVSVDSGQWSEKTESHPGL